MEPRACQFRVEWLRRVATALEVPDLGFMLGGRLTDMGRRPADVRDSGEEDQAPMLRLSNKDGVFLEVDLATSISTTRPDEAVTVQMRSRSWRRITLGGRRHRRRRQLSERTQRPR